MVNAWVVLHARSVAPSVATANAEMTLSQDGGSEFVWQKWSPRCHFEPAGRGQRLVLSCAKRFGGVARNLNVANGQSMLQDTKPVQAPLIARPEIMLPKRRQHRRECLREIAPRPPLTPRAPRPTAARLQRADRRKLCPLLRRQSRRAASSR